MRRPPWRLLAPLALLVVPALSPAQTAAVPWRAEPFTPADHWSRDALRQLGGAGVLDLGAVYSAWPLRRSRVRALFGAAAAAAARAGDPAAGALARGLLARFEEDFPAPAPGRGPALGGALSGGWAGERGRLGGGASSWEEGVGWVYPGPRPGADRSAPTLAGRLDLTLLSAVAASVRARWTAGGASAREAYLSLAGPGFDLWAGRRAFGAGPAHGRGIVLSEGVAFDGLGIAAQEGYRLPGPLRSLGPVRGTVLVARMERSGPYEHPWFAGVRVSLSPHPALAVGLSRATLFGGEGNEAVSPRRVLLMALGFTDTGGKDSDFENQVASVDVVWRTAPFHVPLLLYAEWGFDDIAFAWTNVPGLILGAELPALPGLGGVALGAEHVWFDRSCCGHPPWYRHGALAEGWTDRGAPLGHPLGGHGRESSLLWRIAAPGAGLLADGRLFLRRRGEENLFAPDRAGSSHGGALRLTGHGPGPLRLEGAIELERGRTGWRSWSAAVATAVVF